MTPRNRKIAVFVGGETAGRHDPAGRHHPAGRFRRDEPIVSGAASELRH